MESSQQRCSILAVGPAGVGKSTILNKIVGENVFTASDTVEGGETKTVGIHQGTWLGEGKYPIQIIDTPGMGDPELPLDKLCEDIDEKLKGEVIDIVIVVIKANDYRKGVVQVMAIEFIVEFVDLLKKENTIMVMTHCDIAPPTKEFTQAKIKSYVDSGLPLQLQNLVQFDGTVKSLQRDMFPLLKKGEMRIEGTKGKLKDYLKKVHNSIQTEGNMADAMVFEKMMEMQTKNSQDMQNLVLQLNQQRNEESARMREENRELIAELNQLNAKEGKRLQSLFEQSMTASRKSQDAQMQSIMKNNQEIVSALQKQIEQGNQAASSKTEQLISKAAQSAFERGKAAAKGGGGCFAFGTTFMVQSSNGEVLEKKLEDIKYGDNVLVHNICPKLDTIQHPHFETVVFVDLDQPGSAPYWNMTKIVLEDGSTIVVTDTHMVPILTNKNNISEMRADQLKLGDTLATVRMSGPPKLQTIMKLSNFETSLGVGNFVVQGYPIANGILSSVRVHDDGPELMWKVGYKVYNAFGPLIANMFCNIGYRFI